MEIWDKVGEGMQVYCYHLGPEKDPTDAFALWNLIKEVLEVKEHLEPPTPDLIKRLLLE